MLAAYGQPQAPATAPGMPAGICGNQPLCYDAPDFSATVTNFRLTNNRGAKQIDATVRFTNKTGQALILGYVDNTAVAVDDQGNRYGTYYNNGLTGIGLISGQSGDPKFVLQPGGSGDAHLSMFWRPNPQDPVGSTFQMEMTVREINTVVGGAHTLGSEVPLQFQGLRNGSAGRAPQYAGAATPSSILSGMAGIAGASNPSSAGQANAAAGSIAAAGQQAQTAGQNDASTAANGVGAGATAVGGIASSAGNSQAASNAGRVGNTASAVSGLAGMFKRKPKQQQPGGTNQQSLPQSEQPAPSPAAQPPQAQAMQSRVQSQQVEMARSVPTRDPGGAQAASQPWTPPADNTAPADLKNPLELPILDKMPDVVGVRPGMNTQEALTIMHKQYPADMFQEMVAGCSGGSCTYQAMFPAVAGQKADYGWNIVSREPGNSPDVYLSFTATPTRQVVWRVYRMTRNMHTARSNVLAALREKYGKEALALAPNDDPNHPPSDPRGIGSLWWFFDEHGNRVPPPAGSLGNYGSCGGTNAQPTMPVDESNNQFTGWCKGYVTLHVTIAPIRDPDIIEYTSSDLYDAPLAIRAEHVYMAWKRDAAEKAREAELEKAKKSKPVF
jgi:hypothetical protein